MNTNRGFTLIEVMIVAAIVGIILAVAFNFYESRGLNTPLPRQVECVSGYQVLIKSGHQLKDDQGHGIACTNNGVPIGHVPMTR